MWWWWVACGHRHLEEGHPCDPHGHTRHLVMPQWPEVSCIESRDFEFESVSEAVSLQQDICESIPSCMRDCEAIKQAVEGLQLESRLLDDLEALASLDAQSPECRGKRDRELWPCLGLEPVPDRFGVSVERSRGEIELARIVGPIVPEGPSVLMVGAKMSHGCDIFQWGADALPVDMQGYGGEPVRLGQTPDFTGWLGQQRAAEGLALYQALLAELEACDPRALGNCRVTLLPATMTARFDPDQVRLEGALFPSGPVVSLGVGRGRVWALLSPASALDPRSGPLRHE